MTHLLACILLFLVYPQKSWQRLPGRPTAATLCLPSPGSTPPTGSPVQEGESVTSRGNRKRPWATMLCCFILTKCWISQDCCFTKLRKFKYLNDLSSFFFVLFFQHNLRPHPVHQQESLGFCSPGGCLLSDQRGEQRIVSPTPSPDSAFYYPQ